MKVAFEVLRTRNLVVDESVEVEVDVPDSVPEEEREEWALNQLRNDDLEIPDAEWNIEDEDEHSLSCGSVTELTNT